MIVAGALLCLGGLGVSINEWQNSSIVEKQTIIAQSKLDRDQKSVLTRLVSTSDWAELNKTLLDIRSEYRIKSNLTQNDSARAAFSEVEHNLTRLAEIAERIQKHTEFINRMDQLIDKEVAASPEAIKAMQTVNEKERLQDQAQQAEFTSAAEGYLVAALDGTAKANSILAGEIDHRNKGFLWGIVSAFGGVAMSVGAATKLYLEVSKLRLECTKLRSAVSP